MTFPWTIDRRVASLAIFAGFAAVAFVAQNSAIPGAAPARRDLPPVVASLPLARETADVPPAAPLTGTQVTSATNICETQNWPYYSQECLRGEGATEMPRQVHLPPASTTPTGAAPVTVGLADPTAQKSSLPRHISEAPYPRKVRQTPRYTSHGMLRGHQTQPQVPEGQALAFGW
jgi:hypothetical protein